MPPWKKAPPELVAAFDGALPGGDRRIVRRTMFGYPCALVGGNMATGVFGDRVFVRLAGDEQAKLVKRGGRPFEPMPGRPMRGCFEVPPAIIAKPTELAMYVGRAIDHTATLPPKAPKATRTKSSAHAPAKARERARSTKAERPRSTPPEGAPARQPARSGGIASKSGSPRAATKRGKPPGRKG